MAEASFAARRPPFSLSLGQRIGLFPKFLKLIGGSILAIITGLFRGRDGSPTYKKHVLLNTIKTLGRSFNVLESQYITPNCEQLYLDFCKQNGFNPDIATSETGARGFWLGSKSARYVLVHIHGGGFALDMTSAYFTVMHKLQLELSQEGVDFALFFPIYTLTPHASCPTQLQEAIDAIEYLTKEIGRKAQDIILSADSAGGNLCLGIVSHATHPSTLAPKLEIDGNFAGMFLMSPWVSFDTTWPSMKQNAANDVIQAPILNHWSSIHMNGRVTDNYTEPNVAPAEWWKGVRVDHTLTVLGTDEIFLDPVTDWFKKYKTYNDEAVLSISDREVHIEPFVWASVGDFRETGQLKALKTWLKEHFSTAS